MTVEIKSRFEANDKVQFLWDKEMAIWFNGVIIKSVWKEEERAFWYLIERDNEERFWIAESRIIPQRESEASK